MLYGCAYGSARNSGTRVASLSRLAFLISALAQAGSPGGRFKRLSSTRYSHTGEFDDSWRHYLNRIGQLAEIGES